MWATCRQVPHQRRNRRALPEAITANHSILSSQNAYKARVSFAEIGGIYSLYAKQIAGSLQKNPLV